MQGHFTKQCCIPRSPDPYHIEYVFYTLYCTFNAFVNTKKKTPSLIDRMLHAMVTFPFKVVHRNADFYTFHLTLPFTSNTFLLLRPTGAIVDRGPPLVFLSIYCQNHILV